MSIVTFIEQLEALSSPAPAAAYPRTNGRAHLSIDPHLLESFAVDGKPPRSVITMKIEGLFPVRRRH